MENKYSSFLHNKCTTCSDCDNQKMEKTKKMITYIPPQRKWNKHMETQTVKGEQVPPALPEDSIIAVI